MNFVHDCRNVNFDATLRQDLKTVCERIRVWQKRKKEK